MAWFCNHYTCDACGYSWDDEWSCMCDDDCPNCGFRHLAPHSSHDLSVVVDRVASNRYEVVYSSARAAHHPEYVFAGIFSSRAAAEQEAEKLYPLTVEVWDAETLQ